MSNSSLINYTKISPNSTNPRKGSIKKITIHHMAGNLSVEACGDLFANPNRQASANYGIGSDGRVGMYVEESNRAWTSGNADNDNQAVTIEVANDGGADTDWHVSDTALAKLIDLCTDICKRNNIGSLNFTGNANGNLTMHCYFQATACPGPYLKSKFPYIADEVNKRLKSTTTSSSNDNSTLYRVQVGAYSVKSNAEAMVKKMKAARFDAFIVQVNGMYKVQVGAYNLKSNAEAMQDTLKLIGFDAFITTEQGEATTNTITTAPVTVGSTVKLKQGAKTYEGKTLASFVYDREHKVKEVRGDRVVITYNGTVVAAVRKSELTLV